MSSSVENRADDAAEDDFRGLGLVVEDDRENGGQAG